MNSDDPDIVASRATRPLLLEAPYPEWGGNTPSPYQHAAVEYRAQRRHGLIGDAPGVGKSAESLLYGNLIGAEYTLVVCPAALRLNWVREIKMWSSTEGATIYPVLKSRDGVSLNHNYVVLSYDLLRNDHLLAAILDERWDHLILDEAHAIKDPKGNKRTKAICAPDLLPSVVEHITMLSGTILPNQPIECYNAVRLLNWDAIDRMSLEDFREYYYEEGGGMIYGPVVITKDENGRPCEPYTARKLHWSDKVRNVPRNMRDLQYRLRKKVMVRRLKEDVLDQLPPRRWHPFPIEASKDVKRALSHPGWAQVEKLHQLDPDKFQLGASITGEVGTALRLLGEAKAPAVADYIEELLLSGARKVVVGAWHRNTFEGVADTKLSVLHYLRKRFESYGVTYMDGSTTPRNKQAAVDAFQEDDNVRVIVGQLSVIGEGWTLSAAQDGVLAEPWWVPGKNEQFLDRMHRRGQEGEYVLGHVPVVVGSLDERVLGQAVWKDRNIYQALDAR